MSYPEYDPDGSAVIAKIPRELALDVCLAAEHDLDHGADGACAACERLWDPDYAIAELKAHIAAGVVA